MTYQEQRFILLRERERERFEIFGTNPRTDALAEVGSARYVHEGKGSNTCTVLLSPSINAYTSLDIAVVAVASPHGPSVIYACTLGAFKVAPLRVYKKPNKIRLSDNLTATPSQVLLTYTFIPEGYNRTFDQNATFFFVSLSNIWGFNRRRTLPNGKGRDE